MRDALHASKANQQTLRGPRRSDLWFYRSNPNRQRFLQWNAVQSVNATDFLDDINFTFNIKPSSGHRAVHGITTNNRRESQGGQCADDFLKRDIRSQNGADARWSNGNAAHSGQRGASFHHTVAERSARGFQDQGHQPFGSSVNISRVNAAFKSVGRVAGNLERTARSAHGGRIKGSGLHQDIDGVGSDRSQCTTFDAGDGNRAVGIGNQQFAAGKGDLLRAVADR